MRLQDLNWMDVERYLQTDDRIMLITGSTEQHAYLSLMTDILIPSRVAWAVSEREKVLVAPALNFGVTPMFSSFPGTISLSQSTFDLVMTEVVQSLMYQGFGGFLVLNGHGGNSLPMVIKDMQMEGAVRLDWYDWWRSDAVRQFEQEHQLRLEHANWGENFPFNRVAESPAEEKPLVNLGYLEAGRSVRDVLGDGSYGGPYQIDDDRMNDLFARLVEEAAARLRALARV